MPNPKGDNDRGTTFRGNEDTGAYSRTIRTLPVQPSRCVGPKILGEQPTYARFLQSVKTWIRTCVEEGRENELLDNNASLLDVWNKLQAMPASMDLVRGRKIEVTPHYEWEMTSGPPFWRATSITFEVQEQRFAPPMTKFDVPAQTADDKTPQRIKYYYCSETGVRHVIVNQGERPKPQLDAKSPLYLDEASARQACQKTKPDFDEPGVPSVPRIHPKNQVMPARDFDQDDSPKALPNLISQMLAPFGVVLFFRRTRIFIKELSTLRQLVGELRDLLGGKEIRPHLDNQLNLNFEVNGKLMRGLEFLDWLYRNGTINRAKYDSLWHLYNDALHLLQELELERAEVEKAGRVLYNRLKLRDPIRGYFIEDGYLEQIMPSGYVGLPDYFKGFDAFQQGANAKEKIIQGRRVFVFDNPGLISIKSIDPRGLKNIDITYVERQLKTWIEAMDEKVFEKANIRIINPRKKEIHLILLGNEDPLEFGDKVKKIRALAKKYSVSMKLLQYRIDTGRFVSLD